MPFIYGYGIPESVFYTHCTMKIILRRKSHDQSNFYDVLVTERPYKDTFSPRDAVEMIMAMTGGDIHMIQSFLNSVILYSVDSIIKLSTGEFAKIVQNIPGYPTRPTVITLNYGQTYLPLISSAQASLSSDNYLKPVSKILHISSVWRIRQIKFQKQS